MGGGIDIRYRISDIRRRDGGWSDDWEPVDEKRKDLTQRSEEDEEQRAQRRGGPVGCISPRSLHFGSQGARAFGRDDNLQFKFWLRCDSSVALTLRRIVREIVEEPGQDFMCWFRSAQVWGGDVGFQGRLHALL